MIVYAKVLFALLLVTGILTDNKYEDQLHDWTCHLNYRTPKDFNPQHSFSFGFCFKDPSIYCRQHAVTMNGCKRYRNMGLYCCLMEHAENSMKPIQHPLLTKEMFLSITSNNPRSNRMYHFLLRDTQLGNITAKEEMAIFLSLIFLDTHFLLNMEEHLPRLIAKNMSVHEENDNIKYVGRGAIFVKGRNYYSWISDELNEDLRRVDGHNKTLVNAIEAPEVLLFPTSAFRAAALTWLKSYSVIQNASQGDLFKTLSDGSIENLAAILYHLKGSIEQLPALVDLWQRVRKVLKCEKEITSKVKTLNNCQYEPFCRGKIVHDKENICEETIPKQILCEECNKVFDLYIIINSELQQIEIQNLLHNFVKDVFEKTNGSSISIQFAMNTEIEYSRPYWELSDLMLFLEAMPTPIDVNFAIVLNATVQHIKRKNTKEKRKKIIILASKNLPLLSSGAIEEIVQAENLGINFYSLYTRHHNQLSANATFALDSRQLNIDHHDIIERLCNDPTFVLTNSSPSAIELSKFEKIAFTIRLKFGERNVQLTLKTLKGKITTKIDDSLLSVYPYDKDIEFSISYTVRSTYRIKDTYARFYGGIVNLQIVTLPEMTTIMYEPSAYDINIIIEGLDDKNIFEMELTDLDKLEKPKTGTDLPNLLKTSFWICFVLLALTIIIFIPNSIRILRNIKLCLKKQTGRSQEYTLQSEKMKCPLCLRTLSDNNNEENMQNKEKDIIETDDSPTSKHKLIVCRQGSIPKCDECIKRLDLQLTSHIHCVRVIFSIIFQCILLFATFKDPVNKHCSIVASSLILLMHLILFTFTLEIIHHMSLGKILKKFWLWLLMIGYSIVVSIALESMNPSKILHCWSIVNNIQGKLILASEVTVLSVTFMLLLYFIISARNIPIYKAKHSIVSFLLSIFFVATTTIFTVYVHQQNSSFTKVTFAICNVILVLGIVSFAWLVQIESNDWIRSLCFVKKLRKFCCHDNITDSRDKPFDEKSRHSFKKRDCNNPQPPIKKLLVMPLQPNSCCTSPNTRKTRSPTMPYSIQSVLCSNSDDEDDESLDNEYDNSFEIIVRSKRQRSASAGPTKINFVQKPISLKHHSHESVQPHSEDITTPGNLKKEKPHVNLDAYNVATFVTASPPVIEISHLQEE